MPKCINKVVVFDLDDTIGHFEQLSMFLNGLQLIVDKNISDKYLYKLIDLWPQFLRPGIIDLLESIAKIKKRNKCVKVVIYTNNMGPRSWTLIIKRYLERKINSKGLTLVPVKLFINKKGLAKLELALAKGKKIHDKREDLKLKDAKREIDRRLK